MTLKKWIKPLDTCGPFCNIYIEYEKKVTEGVWEKDEDLIYCGSMYNIPYWLVDYEIAPNDENGKSIFYSCGLKEKLGDEKGKPERAGFVITLREKKNEE